MSENAPTFNRLESDMPRFDMALTDPSRHVLIAGPTASGKSSLALQIAQAQGGVIVNADALQVWSCWNVLTARPSAADLCLTEHALYGHIDPGQSYSVGEWLREVSGLLGQRLIVTGGTGLYLTALTQGLAEIPPVPPAIRAEADTLLEQGGFEQMLAGLDRPTLARIDRRNPARVQRAWEVLRATGRGLAGWQADTGPPLIGTDECQRLLLTADRDWLAERIERRFHAMLDQGALDEVRTMLDSWDPRQQWTRAIGAPELVAYLQRKSDLQIAAERAIAATRQYARSQRKWFRSRMKDWLPVSAEAVK